MRTIGTTRAGKVRLKLHGALLGTLLGLTGCEQQESTLVVVVGGLGSSQLDELRDAVGRECPQAAIVSTGSWDGYKGDVDAIVAAHPHQHLIMVGHSLGCQTIARAAERLPSVDLTIFIDPAWDDLRVSNHVERYVWYQRSEFGLERKSRVLGPGGEEGREAARMIHGGHNSIPHSQEVIGEVVAAVKQTQDGRVTIASVTPR